MNLHILELKNYFTNAICVPVKLLIGACDNHLVKELADEFVTLFEAVMATVRTLFLDSFSAESTERLITLEAIKGICDKVEANRA